MRKITLLVFSVSCCFCSSIFAECDNVVERSDGVISFAGCIEKLGAQKFTSLIEKDDVVEFTSGGGSVDDAIDIALSISKKASKLYIYGYCGSSCVNYIIPSARILEIDPFAKIVLHGDAELDFNWRQILQIGGEVRNFAKILRKEQEFRIINQKAQIIHEIQTIARSGNSSTLASAGFIACQGIGSSLFELNATTLQVIGIGSVLNFGRTPRSRSVRNALAKNKTFWDALVTPVMACENS